MVQPDRPGVPGDLCRGAGCLLARLDHSARYSSPNFLWFHARYERFVYVDRIVVALEYRKRGLARLLYEDLLRQAAKAGHERVVCEVNCVPPNPGSDAFHERLGFEVLGEADLPERGKSVRYLSRALVPEASASRSRRLD